ncbi:Glycoside hydrolase, family 47 [Corchorus olitorius]|uniref:alpha-1,2-Mannosidase n=1 Tax=Corchorus olitorius TaxID=93759 RepID=A0A1R3JL42_9ROSI|nr:Glycoside hydrolase, family 47 [Corchorus olitorius]
MAHGGYGKRRVAEGKRVGRRSKGPGVDKKPKPKAVSLKNQIRSIERMLRKAQDAEIAEQLSKLKEDLEYVRFFPKTEKYVSLFTGGEDSDVVDRRNRLRKQIKANLVAAAASGKDLEETGSEDDGLLDLSDDDFFLSGTSSDEADADDEWTDKSTREQASSASGKAASGMSSDERNQRQVSARALMPPPRPSTKSFSNSVRGKSRFGASSSRNSSIQRAEMSTSSNTSNSRGGSSFKAGGSSNSKTGNSSNLSSNSDARKPRRKRRPKKRKQQMYLSLIRVLSPTLCKPENWLSVFHHSEVAEGVTPEEAKQLRDEVREMFYHAFDGYMEHAFPLDELRPLSCEGEDTLGGYALTLIDSLDTLALLGDRERFTASVEWIGKNLQFDINKTVSVFETTIRVLGGLLSAHLIASDYATGMRIPSYDNQLLYLAEDLARRLLPAFDTPTGIPFGSVNLKYGVDEHESKITSTAGGGTLTLEFGVLSCLTNNPIFEQVTKNAVRGLWARRSKLNLVGAHINVFTGEWTQKDAGIGTSIDSFYEYLLKAYLLFGDEEYLFIFQEAYTAAMHYLYNDPWYVEVNMDSAAIVWPLFNSLQAFWPGLQVLAGDIDPAIRTHTAFFSVWKRYGFTPEGFNLATLSVQHGQKSYPLRPELIESTYWLYKATRDPRYLDAGRDMVASLQYGARCPCGYCHISDVEFHKKEDHMESFFLAETVKYLWLLFDLAVGPENLVENGPYKYIFSTEGHLLPATPQISLVQEHCSYFGAYCNRDGFEQEPHASDTSGDSQETNDSRVFRSKVHTGFQLQSSHLEASPVSGLIKGLCPGLTHGQKYGISYLATVDTPPEDNSAKQKDNVVQSHAVIVVSDQSANQSPSGDSSDDNVKETSEREAER